MIKKIQEFVHETKEYLFEKWYFTDFGLYIEFDGIKVILWLQKSPSPQKSKRLRKQ
jgi:hypothetical protein